MGLTQSDGVLIARDEGTETTVTYKLLPLGTKDSIGVSLDSSTSGVWSLSRSPLQYTDLVSLTC